MTSIQSVTICIIIKLKPRYIEIFKDHYYFWQLSHQNESVEDIDGNLWRVGKGVQNCPRTLVSASSICCYKFYFISCTSTTITTITEANKFRMTKSLLECFNYYKHIYRVTLEHALQALKKVNCFFQQLTPMTYAINTFMNKCYGMPYRLTNSIWSSNTWKYFPKYTL